MSVNQSIDQTSITPIFRTRSGSVAPQPKTKNPKCSPRLQRAIGHVTVDGGKAESKRCVEHSEFYPKCFSLRFR